MNGLRGIAAVALTAGCCLVIFRPELVYHTPETVSQVNTMADLQILAFALLVGLYLKLEGLTWRPIFGFVGGIICVGHGIIGLALVPQIIFGPLDTGAVSAAVLVITVGSCAVAVLGLGVFILSDAAKRYRAATHTAKHATPTKDGQQ